jgi:prepilin-type N-terminal cleavage/methylation domain-containing protein
MLRARQSLYRRVARLKGGESGFTMIELVMAIFIFGLVVTGIAAGMTSTLALSRQNKNRSVAANLASQEMDLVRSTDFTSLPIGQLITTQAVDGVTYTVDRESEWVTQTATSGPCQAPPGSDLTYMAVNVSVTWPNMAGVKPPASSTILAPPIGTYDPNNGHIAVTVRDRNGVPQDGVLTSITGGTISATQYTGVDGCSFFAYEPAGAYTVTLNTTGYVSDQGALIPSQSATVQPGSIVQVQYQYDAASSLVITLAGNTGGPVPAAIPIGVFNTHILPSGIKIVAGSGSPRTVPNLFPFTDGYEVWGGSCLDANPEGVNGSGIAFYPGGARLGPLSMNPGSSTAATLSLPEVIVTTKTAANVPRSNVTVVASHAPDAGCPSGESYALGTSNGAGQVFSALPYGTWTITATSAVGSPSAPASLSPLNPPAPTPVTVTVP